jgi:cytidine deaminase
MKINTSTSEEIAKCKQEIEEHVKKLENIVFYPHREKSKIKKFLKRIFK